MSVSLRHAQSFGRYRRNPLSALTLLLALGIAGAATAQQDTHVWVVGSALFGPQSFYEIAPTGSVVAQHGISAVGFGPAVLASGRDSLGNVTLCITAGAPPFSHFATYRSGVGVVGAGFSVSGGTVRAMEADAAGGLWYIKVGTSTAVVRRMANGSQPWTTPVAAGAFQLAHGPAGGIWVANPVNGTVTLIDANGAIVWSSIVPSLSTVDPAADSLGRLWVLASPTALRRLSWNPAQGQVVVDLSITAPAPLIGLEVDGCDVLCATSSALNAVLLFAPNGQPLPTVPVPLPGLAFAAPGSSGDLWVGAGGSVARIDRAGAVVSNVASVPTPVNTGDATGVVLANVIDPGGDPDADASSNRREWRLGTDPFSASSLPPTVSASAVPGAAPPVLNVVYVDASPGHQSASYQLGVSASATNGIPLGPAGTCPIVPLDYDTLLSISIGPPTNLFQGFSGTLQGGTATASINLPPGIPPGTLSAFLGGVTLGSGGGVIAIADALPVINP